MIYQRIANSIIIFTIFLTPSVLADITDGLVAHYRFDGNSKDSSGNGNDGSESSPIISYITGIKGKAVLFKGCDSPSHIHVPNSRSLQFSDKITISFFARVDSTKQMDGYANCLDDTGESFGGAILAKDNDRSGFVIRTGADNDGNFSSLWSNNHFSSPRTITRVELPGYKIRSWRHIAFVINDKEAKTYVNGVLKDHVISDDSVDFSIANERDLYIGKFDNYWHPFFGAIDDLRIYNRDLSEEEINSLYISNLYNEYIDITYLSDTNNNGYPEIVTLRKGSEKGSGVVYIQDTRKRKLLRKFNFFPSGYELLSITKVPDINGNGYEELSVLGRQKRTGKSFNEIRDSKTGKKILRINQPE